MTFFMKSVVASGPMPPSTPRSRARPWAVVSLTEFLPCSLKMQVRRRLRGGYRALEPLALDQQPSPQANHVEKRQSHSDHHREDAPGETEQLAIVERPNRIEDTIAQWCSKWIVSTEQLAAIAIDDHRSGAEPCTR